MLFRSLKSEFTIGDAEVARLYESLADSIRTDLGRDTFLRASRFFRFELQQEIALQKWGPEGEFRKRIPFDPQLATAVALLRNADSPEALFRAASARASGR